MKHTMKVISLFTLFFAFTMTTSAVVQIPPRHPNPQIKHQGRPKFNPQVFESQLRQFIAQHAGLTQDEQNIAFPIFFEMRSQQRNLRKKGEEAHERVLKERLSEKDAEQIIREVLKMRKRSLYLEEEAMEKMRKKGISSLKIIRMMKSEERFLHKMFKGMKRGDRHQGNFMEKKKK